MSLERDHSHSQQKHAPVLHRKGDRVSIERETVQTDAEAFSLCVYAAAFKLAIRSGFNEEEALDTAGEIVVKAWEHPERYEADKGSVATWVWKNIGRTIITTLRRKLKQTDLSLTTIDMETGLEVERELLDPAPDPLALMLMEYDRTRADRYVDIILERLEERQRFALLLHSIEGLSHQQIAQLRGISEVNSRQLLVKAKKSARAILIPYLKKES